MTSVSGFPDFIPMMRSLEHDDFSSNRHPALSFCLSMIFFGNPVSTFPDHALMKIMPLDKIGDQTCHLSRSFERGEMADIENVNFRQWRFTKVGFRARSGEKFVAISPNDENGKLERLQQTLPL